jgi:molybdopterin/thiamine biosynthesis adenylyltransferase
VYLFNDDGLDFPHIMLREETFPDIKDLPDGKYRWVCLYEQESIVNTIVPYEDKVIDTVDRLLELLSMNEIEKEREFQKEFMLYWNSSSIGQNEFTVYLTQENTFAEMEAYFGTKNVRVIEQGLRLSDIDSRDKNERKWVHHVESDVYFIPISDSRDILPPHRGYSWTSQYIKNIIYAQQVEHISVDTFQRIKNTIPKTQNVILVFGMKSEMSNVVFTVRLKCNNTVGHSLLEKVLEDIVAVEPLFTNRKDYLYLSEQIGNDIGLLKKKVLVVGAGSLGSYIVFELVKNGASHVKIYDGDKLEEENVLRWAFGGIGKGSNKATAVSLLLNLLHPEVNVEAVSKNIDEKALIEEASQADLIIFTVGSSDEQLKFNRTLKATQCSVPVVYVWLEAGGVYSHILIVNYQRTGCFECLYTDENGKAVNNRARKNSGAALDTVIIRNGCGGTRAAYGTAILLRTTAALLDTIQKIQMKEITGSVLIDVSPDTVSISNIKFSLEACSCCGNRERQ